MIQFAQSSLLWDMISSLGHGPRPSQRNLMKPISCFNKLMIFSTARLLTRRKHDWISWYVIFLQLCPFKVDYNWFWDHELEMCIHINGSCPCRDVPRDCVHGVNAYRSVMSHGNAVPRWRQLACLWEQLPLFALLFSLRKDSIHRNSLER